MIIKLNEKDINFIPVVESDVLIQTTETPLKQHKVLMF